MRPEQLVLLIGVSISMLVLALSLVVANLTRTIDRRCSEIESRVDAMSYHVDKRLKQLEGRDG